MAAAAALSGVQLQPLAGARGALDPKAITAAVRPPDEHNPPATLLCLENTHNRAGGAIVAFEALEGAAGAARERGLRVHLDGARLWNASVATGIPIARYAALADTLMMCFSKGLGAPVGSILAGDRQTITAARRYRKMFGGGIRQGGILAAACLHALDRHVDRLAEDHRLARRLADHVRAVPGLSLYLPVETNIVYFEVRTPGGTAEAVVRALRERGIRVCEYGPTTVRAVTHLDVDEAGVERAGEALRGLATSPAVRS